MPTYQLYLQFTRFILSLNHTYELFRVLFNSVTTILNNKTKILDYSYIILFVK